MPKRALLAVCAIAATTLLAPPAVAAGPSADQLRRAASCAKQISNGKFSEDSGGARTIPVCSTGSAVHWKSDFDIDCDGQVTAQCNKNTDPWFQPETHWQQSDGKHLNSAALPFIVVPSANSTWNFNNHNITGGTVAAVVYGNRVAYAVVGDSGPVNMIGEGSYKLAQQLGIDPNPKTGGVSGRVVDFILFPGVKASPIEDNRKAVTLGESAANRFVGNG
ncbi:glycoside hydrolase family 75 protein [Amycolatopsis suaedae]|uniref:Chitosanase of glycosyl hydrolase group 75 n=1 Tax=Amycolatopsis suaedae TaxID=2510978 RepID=A0A4Q7IWQ8_9PSEU|nr:glycoside hydrolase family 75 protein [Amycolatopsis suaedae]RZQ59371.1 hypothetical protein EWH70_34905 [Amycolatopsis suaedae]